MYRINKDKTILPKTTLVYDIQYVPRDDSFRTSKKGNFRVRQFCLVYVDSFFSISFNPWHPCIYTVYRVCTTYAMTFGVYFLDKIYFSFSLSMDFFRVFVPSIFRSQCNGIYGGSKLFSSSFLSFRCISCNALAGLDSIFPFDQGTLLKPSSNKLAMLGIYSIDTRKSRLQVIDILVRARACTVRLSIDENIIKPPAKCYYVSLDVNLCVYMYVFGAL